jgi:flagellar hook-associated protein 2
MVSGIDRDEIIEQMTLGTTTKITNAKNDITKLQWKQEAYRSLSDMIIGLSDNYGSFTSSSSLVDPTLFAKSIISVHGSDKSSKYVTATGSSDLIGNVAISAVRQLATSTVRQSEKRVEGALETDLDKLDGNIFEWSNLEGGRLYFKGAVGQDGKVDSKYFEFKSTYKDTDDEGKEITVNIDYFPKDDAGYQKLAEQLTKSLEQQEITIDGYDVSKNLKFVYQDEKLQLVKKDTATGDIPSTLQIGGNSSQSVFDALGLKKEDMSIDNFNADQKEVDVIGKMSLVEGLTDSKLTFSYNGSRKDITMLTKAEADYINGMKLNGSGEVVDADGNVIKDKDNNPMTNLDKAKMQVMVDGLQERLNQAFGTDNVKAELSSEGKLQFKTPDTTSSISIAGGGSAIMWNLGLSYGDSNKVNLNGKLNQNNIGIDLDKKVADGSDELVYKDGLVINGVKIEGITKDTSINDILSKINSSKAGVKATYVDATGQFMLVSSETGKGREINLDSQLAKDLFGGDENKGAKVTNGQDAIVDVSYGNGVTVTMNRASNTFNLEGLSVTVSGVFGGEWKDDGAGNKVWEGHTADTVTFTAKADVDKVTERVKAYFEAFNELATEVNKQLTSRPDSAYGPLTEEQKAEMNETSIENWENKAKQGLLYGDTIIRDLSGDIQSVMVKLMNSGVNYQDLEKIGISYSEDYKDGGKLIFDESKFRAAMESDPEYVSNVFAGGGNVSKGLTKIVEDTLTPYATRYASRNKNGMGGSYGRLVEEAGSEKAPSTLSNNFIYKQIQEMQERITQLQSKLKTQQDRYIKQFSSMENLISQMNSQSSWLSQISG